MSHSPLVDMIKISPNRNSPRNKPIKKITVHHVANGASNYSVANGLNQTNVVNYNPSSGMSFNYCIDSSSKIGLCVREEDRAWTSSNADNDHQAITIEVANDRGAPDWHVSDKNMSKLVDLCTDICKRNKIPKLIYTGDAAGNLTHHNMFKATACLPCNTTEVLTLSGWKRLSDVSVGDIIATVYPDTLSVLFAPVLNIVPAHKDKTYTLRDLTATHDHTILWYQQTGTKKITPFSSILGKAGSKYLPNAGHYTGAGMPLSDAQIELLIAVQADGHYEYDNRKKINGVRQTTEDKLYLGVAFHMSKERKIERLIDLLNTCGFKYSAKLRADNTTVIRVSKELRRFAEKYLSNKLFTWEWLKLSPAQAALFIDKLLDWDGCRLPSGSYYSSNSKLCRDVVSAVACLNGTGVLLGHGANINKVHFTKEKRSIGAGAVHESLDTVSCVTVESGFILIRQEKRVTVVGNCPGPYLQSKMAWLASEVNRRLEGGAGAAAPSTGSTDIKEEAKASFRVRSILTSEDDYINIRSGPGKENKIVDSISNPGGVFTIVATEADSTGAEWGALKSGIGWVLMSLFEPL